MSNIGQFDIVFSEYTDSSVEVEVGNDVPEGYEEKVVKSLEEKGFIEMFKKSDGTRRHIFINKDTFTLDDNVYCKSVKTWRCPEGMSKSNYGPKGAGAYTPKDNIKRKMNNTGEVVGEGPNVNAKSYSSKPGQLSMKAQAALEARKLAEKNKKQPVKTLNPEELAEFARQRGVEVKKSQPEWTDNEMASKLAQAMPKGGLQLQPTNKDFEQAMVNQGIGMSKEQLEKSDANWGNSLNNFFAEASKPLSARFNSQEEEDAYWASIRIAPSGDPGTY